jgi:FixJ family two-component response regulator
VRNLLSPSLNVSIIDDDESVRTATSRLVRSLGWEARVYASAEAFLASGQLCDTGCVISDVQMPGMNGLELQRHLAAAGNEVPIIFISAFQSDAAREQAIARGALCFLLKPVDDGMIAQCLNSIRSSAAGSALPP